MWQVLHSAFWKTAAPRICASVGLKRRFGVSGVGIDSMKARRMATWVDASREPPIRDVTVWETKLVNWACSPPQWNGAVIPSLRRDSDGVCLGPSMEYHTWPSSRPSKWQLPQARPTGWGLF